jgi:hypothetical protein
MILDRARRHRRTLWIFGGLSLLIWGLSLALREPYSGVLYPGERSEAVTYEMLFFVKNWWTQNPWSLGFTMPYLPYSVESSTLANRSELYNWYPPGVLVIPWLVAVIFGQEPTLNLVAAVNLGEHLVLIGCLGFTALLVSRCLNFSEAVNICLAVSVAAIATFSPGPMYWFLRVYIWDVSVVSLFAVFLLLEAACLYRDCAAAQLGQARGAWSGYRTAQIVVAFCGMWTEWLFFFVYLVWGPLIALRIIQHRRWQGLRPACLVLVMPVLTFASIQIWRLQSSGFDLWREWQRTVGHFMYRAGFINQEAGTIPLARINLWLDKNYLAQNLNPRSWHFLAPIDKYLGWDFHSSLGFVGPALFGGTVIALAVLAASLVRHGRSAFFSSSFALSWTAVLAGLPVLIHFAVFRNHASQHEFVAAKAVVPFALYLGCIAPAFFLLLLRRLGLFDGARGVPAIGLAFALLIPTVPMAYAWRQLDENPAGLMGKFSGQIWSKDLPAYNSARGTTIRKNTGFNDVVVSPDFDVPVFSYDVAHSMKIVERVSEEQLSAKVAALCSPRSLVVVSLRESLSQSASIEQWSDGGLFFARHRPRGDSCINAE